MTITLDLGALGEEAAAAEVARYLLEGGLAVTPTDTVYGLAAKVFEPGAAGGVVWAGPYGKIVKLKGRAGPFIILVSGWPALRAFTDDDLSRAAFFAERYAKPVTFIYNARDELKDERLTSPERKVALRVVNSGFIWELVSRCGPVFSTSANGPTGEPARVLGEVDPTVREAADVEVDGGPAPEGPTAVLDATTVPFKVVRSAPGLDEALGKFFNG